MSSTNKLYIMEGIQFTSKYLEKHLKRNKDFWDAKGVTSVQEIAEKCFNAPK